MEYAQDYRNEIIGQTYSTELVGRYDWGTCWPVIDPETLEITDVVDGSDDLTEYELVDVRDGHIIRREGACDAAIRA